jgi:hypothetical protein
VAKQERLYTSEEGAYATRLSLSSFRTKVSKLGIKGKRQGQKVFYTKAQLQDIYDGVSSTKKPVAKKAKAPKKVAKKTVRKAKR